MCSGFHSSTRRLSHPASAIGCHIASEIFVSHGIIFFFAVLRPEYFRARFFVFKPVFSPKKSRLRQKHQDHAVAAEEEFADEAVAVDGLALLAVRIPGDLAPHLLDVLQDHVAVAIEGFDAREQFAVVAGGDEDLGVVAHGGLEEREGA